MPKKTSQLAILRRDNATLQKDNTILKKLSKPRKPRKKTSTLVKKSPSTLHRVRNPAKITKREVVSSVVKEAKTTIVNSARTARKSIAGAVSKAKGRLSMITKVTKK